MPFEFYSQECIRALRGWLVCSLGPGIPTTGTQIQSGITRRFLKSLILCLYLGDVNAGLSQARSPCM